MRCVMVLMRVIPAILVLVSMGAVRAADPPEKMAAIEGVTEYRFGNGEGGAVSGCFTADDHGEHDCACGISA